MPRLTREKALHILREVSPEKAFHFYTGIDQCIDVRANSLAGFCAKIQVVDVKSIEFHTSQRDFELWLESLGDLELARRMGLIRRTVLSGECLRRRVYESVKSRCAELMDFSGKI